METSQKPRKRDSVRAWVQGFRKTPARVLRNRSTQESGLGSIDSAINVLESLSVQDEGTSAANAPDRGDQTRTRERYLEASRFLNKTLKSLEGDWKALDFPELAGEPDNFDDSQFRDKINEAIESRKFRIENKGALAKCGHAIQCAFAAFSPFAKNFLTIAQQVADVPCLLYILDM